MIQAYQPNQDFLIKYPSLQEDYNSFLARQKDSSNQLNEASFLSSDHFYLPKHEVMSGRTDLIDHYNNFVRNQSTTRHNPKDPRVKIPIQFFLPGRGVEIGAFHKAQSFT